MSQEEGDAVGDQLLLACQNGDAHTLQTLMSSVAGLDLAMTTEDGVTLLMHTIIGAGKRHSTKCLMASEGVRVCSACV